MVVVVAASLLPAAVAAPATAASSFTFHGSGNGHGLGMSQWGAYGLAKMGWSFTRILTHFYQGTEVRSPALPARGRVGLTDDRDLIHITAEGGRVEIWEGEPAGAVLVGEIRSGDTWTLEPGSSEIAVRDAHGALVGDRRWGSPSRPLVLAYESLGARVVIPEAGDSGDGSYGRGTIEAQVYGCGDGCQLRLIARLGLDEYLYGLGEVPSSWPAAALRAQVVAARSYAVVLMRRGLRRSCDCHLTDGTVDQVYVGWSKESGVDGERWVAAVDDTSGRAVTYDGEVIQAFYASSDGGHSEDVEDVWHEGNPAYAIPWLRGVCDPGESTNANSWTDWDRTFDEASLTSRIAPYTGDIGTIRSLSGAERGESGRVITIRAVGANGSAAIEGSELRAALGLPDTRVWVNADRNIAGPIRERYDRLGCAPGLATSAQRKVPGGAQQLFEDGGLYRNVDRLVVVWLRGSIDDEYRSVGAGQGVLGLPLREPVTFGRARAGCTDCKRVDLTGGRIYWKAGIGAHALWGRVLTAYVDEGGATGALGSPLTRVEPVTGGGDKARFEHGTIACPAGEACTVTR